MAKCVYCKKKMLNYGIMYANINYKLSLCWGEKCNGYFEIIPDIESPLTDSIAKDPRVVLDLLATKVLKPIL